MLLSTTRGLQCYAVCRQAERSVCCTLGREEQWQECCAFYNDSLREIIKEVVRDINRGHRSKQRPERGALDSPSTLLHCLSCLYAFVPRLFGYTQLSSTESAFISGSLELFLTYLQATTRPAQEQLVGLRLDLGTCWSVLHCRLFKASGFRIATDVGHYGQSPRANPLSIDEYISMLAGKRAKSTC